MPLARTSIVSGAIFAFAVSMDDVAVSIMLTDANTYTLPVALISSMRANFDLSIAAASVHADAGDAGADPHPRQIRRPQPGRSARASSGHRRTVPMPDTVIEFRNVIKRVRRDRPRSTM